MQAKGHPASPHGGARPHARCPLPRCAWTPAAGEKTGSGCARERRPAPVAGLSPRGQGPTREDRGRQGRGTEGTPIHLRPRRPPGCSAWPEASWAAGGSHGRCARPPSSPGSPGRCPARAPALRTPRPRPLGPAASGASRSPAPCLASPAPPSYSRGRRRAGAGPRDPAAGSVPAAHRGRPCRPGAALATRQPGNRSDGAVPEPGLQPQIFTRRFPWAPSPPATPTCLWRHRSPKEFAGAPKLRCFLARALHLPALRFPPL